MKEPMELKANSIDAIHYKIMEMMHDRPPGKVLDFPSGWGRLSYWLKEKGFNVVSCDIQAYPDSPICHVWGDLNSTFPFDNQTFDYAFCIDGPEHAENLYHVFREFYRILKPNGQLILSIPNYSNIESRVKQFFYGVLEPIHHREDFAKLEGTTTGHLHVNRPPYALLRMAIEAAKFDIVQTTFDKEKRLQKYLYPLYWLIKLVTVVKGEKGDKKYGLRSSNQKNVLMGGNTLILICKKHL
jgi:ubiquinone/menaquinone biosynthesis C-methylase UbiE